MIENSHDSLVFSPAKLRQNAGKTNVFKGFFSKASLRFSLRREERDESVHVPEARHTTIRVYSSPGTEREEKIKRLTNGR